LLNVLIHGTDDDRLAIKTEVLSVLQSAPENSELKEMSTQKVFYIMDWLSKWLDIQRKATRSTPRKAKTKTQEKAR
jgi:hypothetical protein